MTNMFLNNVLGMKMYFFFFNNILLGKSTASVAFFLMSILCCRSLSFWFIFVNTLLALLLKSSLQVSWYLTSFATKSIFYILAKRAVSSTILAFRIIPSCTLVVMHITRWSFFLTFFGVFFTKQTEWGKHTISAGWYWYGRTFLFFLFNYQHLSSFSIGYIPLFGNRTR